MAANNKLMVVDESTLKDKIYTIRGQQVMLDSDLAEIYGYETRYLNYRLSIIRIVSRMISCFS